MSRTCDQWAREHTMRYILPTLVCLVAALSPCLCWGQPGPISPEDFAVDAEKLRAALTDNLESNLRTCMDTEHRITHIVYNRAQWQSQAGIPELLLKALNDYKSVCDAVSPGSASLALNRIEQYLANRSPEHEAQAGNNLPDPPKRAKLHNPNRANQEKIASPIAAPRPYNSYPHAISTFMLRQTCRNIIQQRLNNWNIDFQHADLMEPARLENMSRWFSWFIIPRTTVRQYFRCSHDALTDWTEVRFTKRD